MPISVDESKMFWIEGQLGGGLMGIQATTGTEQTVTLFAEVEEAQLELSVPEAIEVAEGLLRAILHAGRDEYDQVLESYMQVLVNAGMLDDIVAKVDLSRSYAKMVEPSGEVGSLKGGTYGQPMYGTRPFVPNPDTIKDMWNTFHSTREHLQEHFQASSAAAPETKSYPTWADLYALAGQKDPYPDAAMGPVAAEQAGHEFLKQGPIATFDIHGFTGWTKTHTLQYFKDGVLQPDEPTGAELTAKSIAQQYESGNSFNNKPG